MGTSDRSPAITQAAKHYRRGLEDFRGGRFREAARHLRKAVEVDPANIDWRYDLAVALQQAERHAEAAAEYRRVLDTGGDAADALTNLALCLWTLGRLHEAEGPAERAENCFRRVLAVDPRHRAAGENLAGVFYAMGRLDEAAACACALVADEPGSAEGHVRLAVPATIVVVQRAGAAADVVAFAHALGRDAPDLTCGTTISRTCSR